MKQTASQVKWPSPFNPFFGITAYLTCPIISSRPFILNDKLPLYIMKLHLFKLSQLIDKLSLKSW